MINTCVVNSKMKWKNIQNFLLQVKGEVSTKKIILGFVFFFIAAIVVNSIISNIQLRYEKSQLSNQVFELNNQNKALEQKNEQTTTNRYIEELAREKLGMVKSNEVPIKIVEKKAKSTEEETLKPSDKMGIYMKDWYTEVEKWVTHIKKG